jgi:hypothetical protein
LDDKIRQLLKELGVAINQSVSGSEEVNDQIQRIRDEGYSVFVVLDATIGLDREGEPAPARPPVAEGVRFKRNEAQFRINISDLTMLRSLGIDPTRRVRAAKRLEASSSGDAE